MFSTYILKSKKDNNLYIGSTSDLNRRIKEHNAGFVQSTKHRTPFKLVYAELYACEDDARKREHNLKLHAKALRQLILRIKGSLAS